MDRATPLDGQISSWAERYGAKHRWTRLMDFPSGIEPPKKVRLYRRADHYLLNWWDPGEGKNLSERVDGDLLAALVRVREIDERITSLRTAGVGRSKRIGHADLVGRFVADLTRRANTTSRLALQTLLLHTSSHLTLSEQLLRTH